MQYGYYEDIDEIFDASRLCESDELMTERLMGQIEACEEQIDEMTRELEQLSRTVEGIRDRLEEHFGGR